MGNKCNDWRAEVSNGHEEGLGGQTHEKIHTIPGAELKLDRLKKNKKILNSVQHFIIIILS